MHRLITGIAVGVMVLSGRAVGAQEIPLDKLTLPPGFAVAVYAPDVPNARSLARSPAGTLFVSTRSVGDVYAVLDRDQDQMADEVITIATGLTMPVSYTHLTLPTILIV